MSRETPTNPEQSQVNPVLELIALHLEREAMGWLTEPEEVHPLKGAIENGWFGTQEERRQAVIDDGKDVTNALMKVAEEVRQGETKRAFNLLRMQARRSPEAFSLMKALDPEAKPWYPDADANGEPVVEGKRYRWQPGNDNQGNEPGYYNEGLVTKVEGGMAYSIWEKIGEENPEHYYSKEKRLERLKDVDDEEYIEMTLEVIEETIPRETCVPTGMLSPIEEDVA
jgi:hypothetical protein